MTDILEDARPRSALSSFLARRLTIVAAILSTGWVVETIIASGPFVEYYGRHTSNLVSIGLFLLAFAAATRLASTSRGPIQGDTGGVESAKAKYVPRAVALGSILLTSAALLAGRAGYNPLLTDEGRSDDLLSIIWAPVAVGAAAALISAPRRLRAGDWLLLAGVGLSAALVGGRTTPGLILVMLLARYVFFPAYPSLSPRKLAPRTVILFALAGLLAALAFSAAAATRAATDGNVGFSDSNLAFYGYATWPTWLQSLAATLGVIGESSHVTHAVVPDTLGFQGIGLLMEDIFSFLPGQQRTITATTIDVYAAAGSVVFVSRPGGTVATLYLLGGDIAVVAGASVYAVLLFVLARRVYAGARVFCPPAFLVLFSTLVVGVYGTGTPTALTFLAVTVASVTLAVSRTRSSVMSPPRSRLQQGSKDPERSPPRS